MLAPELIDASPEEMVETVSIPSNHTGGYYPDVMVDLETTGILPDRTGILQIAAVRFNLKERTIDTSYMFDRCMWLPPTRFWQESTRQFWSKQKPDILRGILARGENPADVMQDLRRFALQDLPYDAKPILWAKPSHFEYNFLSSYFNDTEVENPFHYRYVRDMYSYLSGYRKVTDLDDLEQEIRNVPFNGDAHNALFDALHQLSVLFTLTGK